MCVRVQVRHARNWWNVKALNIMLSISHLFSLPETDTVVVVRNKAINHLHERGPDRRTVCQSVPIYLVSRGSHASTLSLS